VTLSAETLSPRAALALLAWQIELGADEAIGEVPVDRYALAEAPAEARVARPAPQAAALPPPPAPAAPVPALHGAREIAAACADLDALRAAMAAFEGCALKKGARTLVFADGNPAARVMVIGEAPGREEDREGLPFVGRSGRLLDRMLAAIGLSRKSPDPAQAVYITNVLPWRPPENREPSSDEIAMMKAFLLRHIAIAGPDVLLLMGRTSVAALLDTNAGITRLRGHWAQVLGRPALPTFHPAALLRNPILKRDAWRDLLALSARLDGGTS
jgi:DNA polymerase